MSTHAHINAAKHVHGKYNNKMLDDFKKKKEMKRLEDAEALRELTENVAEKKKQCDKQVIADIMGDPENEKRKRQEMANTDLLQRHNQRDAAPLAKENGIESSTMNKQNPSVAGTAAVPQNAPAAVLPTTTTTTTTPPAAPLVVPSGPPVVSPSVLLPVKETATSLPPPAVAEQSQDLPLSTAVVPPSSLDANSAPPRVPAPSVLPLAQSSLQAPSSQASPPAPAALENACAALKPREVPANACETVSTRTIHENECDYIPLRVVHEGNECDYIPEKSQVTYNNDKDNDSSNDNAGTSTRGDGIANKNTIHAKAMHTSPNACDSIGEKPPHIDPRDVKQWFNYGKATSLPDEDSSEEAVPMDKLAVRSDNNADHKDNDMFVTEKTLVKMQREEMQRKELQRKERREAAEAKRLAEEERQREIVRLQEEERLLQEQMAKEEEERIAQMPIIVGTRRRQANEKESDSDLSSLDSEDSSSDHSSGSNGKSRRNAAGGGGYRNNTLSSGGGSRRNALANGDGSRRNVASRKTKHAVYDFARSEILDHGLMTSANFNIGDAARRFMTLYIRPLNLRENVWETLFDDSAEIVRDISVKRFMTPVQWKVFFQRVFLLFSADVKKGTVTFDPDESYRSTHDMPFFTQFGWEMQKKFNIAPDYWLPLFFVTMLRTITLRIKNYDETITAAELILRSTSWVEMLGIPSAEVAANLINTVTGADFQPMSHLEKEWVVIIRHLHVTLRPRGKQPASSLIVETTPPPSSHSPPESPAPDASSRSVPLANVAAKPMVSTTTAAVRPSSVPDTRTPVPDTRTTTTTQTLDTTTIAEISDEEQSADDAARKQHEAEQEQYEAAQAQAQVETAQAQAETAQAQAEAAQAQADANAARAQADAARAELAERQRLLAEEHKKLKLQHLQQEKMRLKEQLAEQRAPHKKSVHKAVARNNDREAEEGGPLTPPGNGEDGRLLSSESSDSETEPIVNVRYGPPGVPVSLDGDSDENDDYRYQYGRDPMAVASDLPLSFGMPSRTSSSSATITSSSTSSKDQSSLAFSAEKKKTNRNIKDASGHSNFANRGYFPPRNPDTTVFAIANTVAIDPVLFERATKPMSKTLQNIPDATRVYHHAHRNYDQDTLRALESVSTVKKFSDAASLKQYTGSNNKAKKWLMTMLCTDEDVLREHLVQQFGANSVILSPVEKMSNYKSQVSTKKDAIAVPADALDNTADWCVIMMLYDFGSESAELADDEKKKDKTSVPHTDALETLPGFEPVQQFYLHMKDFMPPHLMQWSAPEKIKRFLTIYTGKDVQWRNIWKAFGWELKPHIIHEIEEFKKKHQVIDERTKQLLFTIIPHS